MFELDIDVFDGADAPVVSALIVAAGGTLGFASEFSASIRATLLVQHIEAVAAAKAVRFVGRKGLRRANKINTSEGDKTHKTDLVRS
jgi:hypothetical protein